MIQFAPPNMKPLHSTHFAHRQAFQNHSVSQSNLLLWCCSTILWGSGILMCFSISVSTFRRHGSWTRGRFSISTFRRYGSWTRGPCIDTYLWLGAHVTQVTFMSYVVFVSVLTVMAAVYPTPPPTINTTGYIAPLRGPTSDFRGWPLNAGGHRQTGSDFMLKMKGKWRGGTWAHTHTYTHTYINTHIVDGYLQTHYFSLHTHVYRQNTYNTLWVLQLKCVRA